MSDVNKIMWLCGAGDVVGTYRYWKQGKPDPRVPVQTYSGMFYDAVKELGAEGFIVHATPDGEELDDGDFHFRNVRHGAFTGALSYYLSLIRVSFRLARVIREVSPDIVMMASNEPLLTVRLVPSRIRVIYSAHNTLWPMHMPPKRNLKNILTDWFWRFGFSRIDGALCTSVECKRQIEPFARAGIPMYAQRPALVADVQLRQRSDRVRNLIYVGRVEADKGTEMLFDAFSRLAHRTPELRLVYVGDGGALEDLRAKVAASDLAPRVEVRGRLMAAEVNEALAASDLLVCPTNTGFKEGLAMVCVEAAANGVPSLVSSVVPAQDILGEAGRVFEADDTDDLEKELGTILDDPALYTRMVDGAEALAARLKDTSETWGSQLVRLARTMKPRR